MWWQLLTFVLGGYLLGAVSFGWLAGRLGRGIDVRAYGSGKTGFTNTLRALGLPLAALVLVGDVAKGAAPVLAARLAFDEPWLPVAGGLAAIVGHVWPVYLDFRGGAGVATTAGASLALNPLVALAAFGLAALVLAWLRYMSVASLTGTSLAALGYAVVAAGGWGPWQHAAFGAGALLLVTWRHRANLRRLRAGTEPKIGQRVALAAGPEGP